MTTVVFSCPAGHTFEVEDTGDAASGIALRQTALRFEPEPGKHAGGCDHHVKKERCGLPVTRRALDTASELG